MKQHSASSHDGWCTVFMRNPAASVRLFCFPYAGANASEYRTWHSELPPTVELYAIQLPGRGNRIRESPIAEFNQLLPALATSIQPLLDRPSAFFGHSLGALLCFEVARWLRRQGHVVPAQLFVSGRRAPQHPDPDTSAHLQSDDEFLSSLRQLNGTPPDVLDNPELMTLVLPTLKADFALGDTYEYRAEPPLSCPITVFAGHADPEGHSDLVEGWHLQTSATFTTHVLPGDHFFPRSARRALLALLADALRHMPFGNGAKTKL